MDGWSIKGDPDITPTTVAGVTYGLDETERSFEDMGFLGWDLKFQSLADDTFSYTKRTENAKGKGTVVPYDGQEIKVFHNGIRRFKGWVVKPKLDLGMLSITAYGPWYFATRITLSGDSTDGSGGNVPRSTYGFPEQGMQETFRTLIHRASQMGVPWRGLSASSTAEEINDRIANMFVFGKTTLSNMSFAAAISYFMENVADAVAWFDYSSGTADPELIISRRSATASGRRSTMDATSYAVGATGTTRVISAPIYPRLEQKVAAVRVNYAQRQLGKAEPLWSTQRAGASDTALDADEGKKRRVHIITFSGPEAVDYTPAEKQESAMIRTMGIPSGSNIGQYSDYVAKRAGAISSLIESNGRYGGVGRGVSGYTGTSWEVAKWVGHDLGTVRLLNPDGTKAATAGKYLMLTPDEPEWFRIAPYKAKKVKITGTWMSVWDEESLNGPPSAGWKAWYDSALRNGRLWKYEKRTSSSTPVNLHWFAIPFECDAVLVSVDYPTKTKVWKPLDWDYYAPPANLADNVFDAENWLPFEGPVTIRRPDLNGFNGLQRKFNLTNAHPDYDGMNALVRSVSYRGPNTVVWDLGAPARIDSAGLVNKMRRSRQDNIKWL
jgi:hypothetical protein